MLERGQAQLFTSRAHHRGTMTTEIGISGCALGPWFASMAQAPMLCGFGSVPLPPSVGRTDDRIDRYLNQAVSGRDAHTTCDSPLVWHRSPHVFKCAAAG